MTYRPFGLVWDDAPVDLSFVYAEERPAGRHGFLRVAGDQFEFEDGAPGRFWGTCFNSGANFPRHAESERIAERLAKFGVNLVRTHQMDSEWATPNIFEVNRAVPRDDTRRLDPVSLDRLDYLFHCLKERGIYIYLDLLTYRQFLCGDGVRTATGLPAAAKPYLYFDSRLIALQKEFNEQLWSHVNPYTGAAYRDEPAIVLTELINECDFLSHPAQLEPYRSELESRYLSWSRASGLAEPETPVDFAKATPAMTEFYSQIQASYYREMIQHLRSVGVRIPIAGTNWSRNLMTRESQEPTDFYDTHWYWNFPFWESSGTHPVPMVRERRNGFVNGVFERRVDRPFFVSEWDHAWPDEWRAESSIAYAAVTALQGWSGMAIHTYRYASYGPVDHISGGASTINGVTYRNHFDSFNDPAKFGLFYHAALIVRRADVRRAEKVALLKVPDQPSDGSDWRAWTPNELPGLELLAEQHVAGVALAAEPCDPDVVLAPGDVPAEGATSVVSDTGEVSRDWSKGVGIIDTPRTKAVYGFVGTAGRLSLNGLAIDARTDFAVIALSSLSDDPTGSSRSLLLSAIGRCDNTGARYDAERGVQLDRGQAPVLIEVIEARIALKTSHNDLKVWLISDRSEAVTPLKVTYANGELIFDIGPQPDYSPSSMYYLIRP
jgi:hypothetical protein